MKCDCLEELEITSVTTTKEFTKTSFKCSCGKNFILTKCNNCGKETGIRILKNGKRIEFDR